MPPLIGMQKWRRAPTLELQERLLEHVPYEAIQGAFLYLEGHDFAIEEVHDRGQVELFTADFELGHVSHPLLVRPPDTQNTESFAAWLETV